MSDTSQGEGWWIASDGKWYAPEQHPDYVADLTTPVRPATPTPAQSAETVAMPGPSFIAPSTPVDPAGAATTLQQPAPVQPIADPNYDLSTNEKPSKSRGLILGLGALVLIAGLGFLAFRFLGGGGATGGADSPEAAMDQLIASINERDAVGFVDVFDPDEIEAWAGSFSPSFAQFESVSEQGEATNDLTEAYSSLFESFDYSITGPRGEAVTYELQELDDDGRITRVRVNGLELQMMIDDNDTAIIGSFGGDATALDVSRFDGTRVELTDEREGLAARLFVPGEEIVEDFGEGHIDVVTVQKDGKWFISIGYSILEVARQQGEFDGFPNPDFGRAFELVDTKTGGADSPEAAVQTLFDSIEQLDYETIMQITDPLATPYLHDYQPLIDSEVDEDDRREAVRETNLSIDDPELTISEWDGRTLVTFDSLEARSSQGDFVLDTSSWCLSFDDGLESDQVCAEDGIAELLLDADSNMDPRDFIPDETGIVVIERNGRWYLDALGTMGYYADQVSQVGAELSNELNSSTPIEFASFFIVEGPIASLGTPATATAESGAVAVALDLSDYPVLENDFDRYHIAVARAVTDQPGNFVGYPEPELDGEAWMVVYDRANDDPELPAIAATTDGQLDVELFEAPVTEVGADGFSGQLGGQGRPQVFYFGPDALDGDLEIQGASAETVYGWNSNGVVHADPDNDFSFLSAGTFIVVTGEPGASFDITVTSFEFDEPEPEPGPTDGLDDFDFSADVEAFEVVILDEGYEFSNDVIGGYFDNCGGPNDPDVFSYIYENGNFETLIITPYPSFDRAASAFDQLVNIASPCDGFTNLTVEQVTLVDINNVRIDWHFDSDPDMTYFEHYRLIDNRVVIASNLSLDGLADQILLFDSVADN